MEIIKTLYALTHPRRSFGLDFSSHLDATCSWILYAQRMSGNGGISKGYDLLRNRWAAAYPETTGYTIPTLLNVANLYNRSDLYQAAIKAADFLLNGFLRAGGIIHWQADIHQQPIVFDTGQVIFGWIAAYQYSQDFRYIEAAKNAAEWLISVQDKSGAWHKHQHLGTVKVIDTRVSWGLLELSKYISEDKFERAAIHNLNWALENQHQDGWFHHCVFKENEYPLTHTLAYSAEGLLMSGKILNEDRYIHAARQTAMALRNMQRKDGSLPSNYAQGWIPKSQSSCLTGNCQSAILWMHFYQIEQDQKYLEAAIQAINFVASVQNMEKKYPELYGGIPGSYPIWGHYERLKYPNWAAKFFVDALIMFDLSTKKQSTLLKYPG